MEYFIQMIEWIDKMDHWQQISLKEDNFGSTRKLGVQQID